MSARDAEARRARRRQARQRGGAARLAYLARRQLTLDNEVAAELAGSEDAVLRALEGHLDCELTCAATSSRWTATTATSKTAATVVDELVELIEQGHEIAPGRSRR